MVPIYFGDDLTDEDAFFALRDDGVTILVSEETRPSWAKYRAMGSLRKQWRAMHNARRGVEDADCCGATDCVSISMRGGS